MLVTRTTPVRPANSAARRGLGYALALLLPWLNDLAQARFPGLHDMPLVLPFASIALVALFFDLGALGLVVAVQVFFNARALLLAGGPAVERHTFIRCLMIVAGGVLLFLRTRHQRRTEDDLRIAVASLREGSATLIEAQQAGRSAAWIYNTRDGRTQWYEGGSEIFGRSLQDFTELGSTDALIFEEDRPWVQAAKDLTARTGQPFAAEFRVLWPNGETHWLEARGAPLATEPTLWRGVTMDVTERKLAEAALLRSEKLAAVGRLASSIAHEINNPLESVINLVYLARSHAGDETARTYLRMADEELARIAQITSQTLRFHRQQSAAAEVDIAEMLRSVLLFYRRRCEQAGIQVRLEAGAAPPLHCYVGEIRQVMTNLIGNALDAMPDGGTLRLRVGCISNWRKGASALKITIADTGHGMSAETRKRIFEPFFTTRQEVGTGLGLWVTAGIVDKHRGTLSTRSSTAPGRSGTVFMLVLPYLLQAQPARPVAEVESTPVFEA
jgi:PAS domain S-box-containing protein